MQVQKMKLLISLEYAALAAFTGWFYVRVGGFDWYWLFVLFIFFDLSAGGYLINKRIGALVYNIGHSLIGPILLMCIYMLSANNTILFWLTLWFFHIFVDRAFGYGLKHTTSFHHTHLGVIGNRK